MKRLTDSAIAQIEASLRLQGFPQEAIERVKAALLGERMPKASPVQGKVEYVRRYATYNSHVCPMCGGGYIETYKRADGVGVGYCRCGAMLHNVDGTIWANDHFAHVEWSDVPTKASNEREYITKVIHLQ